MDNTLVDQLLAGDGLSEASREKLRRFREKPLLSLHVELIILLSLGATLLTTGLGILVYENIDRIGHAAVLALIALLTIAGYAWCWSRRPLFRHRKVETPGILYDTILLLAASCLVTFVGYLQFRFGVFGTKYGLATAIPTVLLFITAYRFDHAGILSMALTGLAAWCGIAVTPARALSILEFDTDRLILTAIALGAVWLAAADATERRAFKPHFAPLYFQFGLHTLCLASLAGIFQENALELVGFVALGAMAAYFFLAKGGHARFITLVFLSLYLYVAISTAFVQVFLSNGTMLADFWPLLFLYFIASPVGLIFFFIHMNKRFKKTHDRL